MASNKNWRWHLVALTTIALLIPAAAAGGTTLSSMPPGWVPAPAAASGEFALAPGDSETIQSYVNARLSADPAVELGSYLYQLGITRWWWEENIELETWLLPGGSANDFRGFLSFVDKNSQLGIGCLFQLGHFPDFDCTAELPTAEIAAIPPALGMTLLRTPQQFVDEVWPLSAYGEWWEDVPNTQTGDSRWATSCVDLRMESPGAVLAGGAAAATAVAGYAKTVVATSAATSIKTTLVGWFGGSGVAAGFITASTGVSVAATATTVGVIFVVGGVVAYAGYKTGKAIYASTFTSACPGCSEMQREDYRCQVVNDTCDCWETSEDHPYSPGDSGGDDPKASEEEHSEDPHMEDSPDSWSEVPETGCAEWVTHYGSFCEEPCEELAMEDEEIYSTEEDDDDEESSGYEWTSCLECATGTFGFQGVVTGCVGNATSAE